MNKNGAIVAAILFYVGWFGSVFLGRTQFAAVSFLFPLSLIGFLFFKKEMSLRGFVLASVISFFGMAFDALMIHIGFVVAQGETFLLIPFWLISIWLLFTFSILRIGPNFNLPLWLSALLGLIMGPLSYKSGEVFQVLTFANSLTMVIYAIFWAVMFPIILTLAKRFQ